MSADLQGTLKIYGLAKITSQTYTRGERENVKSHGVVACPSWASHLGPPHLTLHGLHTLSLLMREKDISGIIPSFRAHHIAKNFLLFFWNTDFEGRWFLALCWITR